MKQEKPLTASQRGQIKALRGPPAHRAPVRTGVQLEGVCGSKSRGAPASRHRPLIDANQGEARLRRSVPVLQEQSVRLLCLRVLRLGAVNLGKPRVAFRRVALVRIALQEPAGLIGRAHRGHCQPHCHGNRACVLVHLGAVDDVLDVTVGRVKVHALHKHQIVPVHSREGL